MRKLYILAGIVMTSLAAHAQASYNWFDPADCDADGWLWFDTDEKLEKYCGYGSKFQIQLVDALYENDDFEYPAPELDATVEGYNKAGVIGGDGAKTGAIVLPAANPDDCWINLGESNGGGFMLYLPDLAKLDILMSCRGNLANPGDAVGPMYAYLSGGAGHLRAIDCITYNYWAEGIVSKPITKEQQYLWKDIASTDYDYYDFDTDATKSRRLDMGKDNPVTVYVSNNNEAPLYIHGIRVYTYQQNAGVDGILADNGLSLNIADKTVTTGVEAEISVYSVAGVKLLGGTSDSLDCSSLPAGVYIVNAKAGNAVKTAKMAL